MDPYLDKWEVENEEFWESKGKKIAYRNLAISIPSLLCAFAVWLYWSIITVQMKDLGFPFEDAQLFTLAGIAGLTGATLRIPNSFLIAISGGRNVIALTNILLLIPALLTGIALGNKETPFAVFAVLASLSGVGGGAFASSMSNISFFFPKRMQGLSLGLNAGLGNVGVSVMQVLLPLVMTYAVFGAISGSGLALPNAVGDKIAGTIVYIQNAGYVWVPVLGVLAIAAWFGMNNVHDVGHSSILAVLRAFGLVMVGFCAAAIGLYLLIGLKVNMWAVLPITIVLTVLFMKLVPGQVKERLDDQFVIFKDKHNWVMTIIYTMTFGSFIGYSAAFPLLIKVVFGYLPDGVPNPNAPNPFAYAWLGPLVGSLIRPVGGWISDKTSGAKVTFFNTIVMVGVAIWLSTLIKQANGSPQPEIYFTQFLIAFLILFTTTGIGNGSTFQMIPIIFTKTPQLAGPVLGWTSAIAAYGAFIIPKVFGGQIKAGTPEYAFYGFGFYYFICLLLTWWYYSRKGAERPC